MINEAHCPTAAEEIQADLDEQARFEAEERERDERERWWAEDEEARKQMHGGEE